MSNSGIKQPLSCTVNGLEWSLYSFSFTTPDGWFSSHLYAISDDHARMLLEDLKTTAKLDGQVVGAGDL